MNRPRAKNLSDKEIAEIVGILDGWRGKLSWESLIEAIEKRMYAHYTRQALHRHERIRQAFSLRKKDLAPDGGTKQVRAASPELQVALDRIARLKAENDRLKAENERLLEQFVCWAYNAHTRGLDQEFLNRPLPRVNRDQTRLFAAK